MAPEERIGPYRILRLIESGGQGAVYLGYDERLHRRVAIKIRPLPAQRDARRALLDEARLAAGMHCPRVVQVYDVIESDSHLGVVMEYVPGCTLEDFLTRAQPSLGSLITVGQDLAVALTHARQRGVVHGDVKASNVLLTRDGRAKLADFGISRRLVAQPPGSRNAGTPAALSPEHYRGQAPDHRSDLFALGIILYRMLTGRHPFYRDGAFDATLLTDAGQLPLAGQLGVTRDVPRELLELVEGLLCRDPQRRIDTTLRVREVLLAISRELPIAEADSLQRECAPYFRSEPNDELPQRLPGGFDKRVRFHYIEAGGWRGRAWHWLKTASWCGRAVLAVTVAALCATPVATAFYYTDTVVRFREPLIDRQGGPRPARDINRQWLLTQVKAVMRDELGRLDVIGEVDAGPQRTLYSPAAALLRPGKAQEEYAIGLRCVEGICVFSVDRRIGSRRLDEQAVLLADMPADQWRDIVRQATGALFD